MSVAGPGPGPSTRSFKFALDITLKTELIPHSDLLALLLLLTADRTL
jgi:hypothetical protein